MKKILNKIFNKQILSGSDINEALTKIVTKEALPEQAAAFLGGITSRGETPEELVAFAKFLKTNAKKPALQNQNGLIDVCGTGGDHSNTFNVSTAVAFVIAGAGATVIKHGNRSVSSSCGSADVLEKLGVTIELPETKLQEVLDDARMVFLFAQNYHPSMANIKEIRKAIGVPTIFNLLGPLVNPSKLDFQVIGVYDQQKCELMAQALLQLGIKEAIVVSGADNLDEFSTTGDNIFYHIKNGKITCNSITPEDVGLKRTEKKELEGGDATQNAQIIIDILDGQKGPKRDIVLLNSAAALLVAGIAKDFNDGIKLAAESIDSNAAKNVLEKLKNVSG